MPRRRPECGAARAVGGTGPGGPVRQPELQRYRGAGARREAGSPKRGGKPGRRCEKRDADAGRKERRRRHPHRVARTGRKTGDTEGTEGRPHVPQRELQQSTRAAAAEEPAEKHTQPQRRALDRVRMPEPQRSPQESTRSRSDARRTGCGCRSRRGARRKAHAAAEEPAGQGTDAEATEVPAEAAKTARAAPCTGGASVPAKSDAERKPDPSRRPTSARLSPDFRPTFAGRARAASGASHRANGPSGKNKSPRLHSVGLFG